MNLDKIAKDISELEAMPQDESYFEACYLVALNVYELDDEDATRVAEIIQEKYL